MVVYAVTASVSVSAALVAGMIPGILGGLLLMAINYTFARRRNWQAAQRFDLRELIRQGLRGFFAVFAPIIIIGGFVVGYFTPTEALGCSSDLLGDRQYHSL